MGQTQAKAPDASSPPSPSSPANRPGRRPLVGRFLFKLGTVVALALVIGSVLERLVKTADAGASAPAGFGRGVAQGALMPLALPNLLVGRDVSIYALNNTGRTYKLGYTVGVNGCGAVFFGFFFWRLNRLRKRFEAGGGGK